ncbi:dihydrofolate reductase family protein [Deinococcus aquiradiocola]|uniref:Pyrimidine reductase n=1 Tax=Deinococcus aquiradiocola TaxID=393059 RepID=A0A917P9G9_9DEIO|nr:dihydrofolate reductase family protein [Deinococcus aquiradiocola]GGJ67446.1 pyrimidine reductase [Deinococcus aquiradiocola]
MARLVISEFLTLDGVMEHPAWSAPYWSDDIAAFKAQEMQAAQALLLGRRTYEAFAQAWPGSADPGAPRMNAVPKYVVTRTLTHATWQNTTVLQDVERDVPRLKDTLDGDLLVYGSGDLALTLLRAGLVDELNLLVYPVTLGAGQRLFPDGHAPQTLTLTEARPYPGGVLLLRYAPTPAG